MRHGSSGRASLLIALIVWVLGCSPAGSAPRPEIGSSAAVLMDMATGAVLFDRAMHERRAVASTTKIMTALVALESASLSDTVVIGPGATEVESPGLEVEPGERLVMDDLLVALLLKSSNSAAVAIAEHVAGSVEAFAGLMNERARSVGARDTHFTNPHGLHHPDHYSSAYDLALITRAAMGQPRFRELVAQQEAEIARPDAGSVVALRNHNKLLSQAGFVDGVKTGYVRQSGQCLVASGTKEGWQLVAVVLNSPDTYGEALSLLEYGFSAYRLKVFARRGDAVGRARVRLGRMRSVPVVCQQTLAQAMGPGLPGLGRLQVEIEARRAPVREGQVLGEARLLVDGQVVAVSPLAAAAAVPRSRLVVMAGWALSLAALLAVAAVGIRTGAKLVQSRRRRRRGLPPQGGGDDPGGPRSG